MKILKVVLLIVLFSGICFGFNEAEFKAEQKQFDKDFKASQEKFDKEFEEKRDNFNKEFEAKNKEFEFEFNLVVGLIILMAIFIISFNIRKYLKYKKIQLLEVYLAENPMCKTDNGIKCVHCGSKSIRNFGLYRADDAKRLHICNSCGKTLYRSIMIL